MQVLNGTFLQPRGIQSDPWEILRDPPSLFLDAFLETTPFLCDCSSGTTAIVASNIALFLLTRLSTFFCSLKRRHTAGPSNDGQKIVGVVPSAWLVFSVSELVGGT